MRMLPEGLRPALYVRDDDYRLSFLQGNFVTLTNLSEEDVERIIEQHLSPLNVSLHAVDAAVRERMMGRNHARGLEVVEQLHAAGIEFHAQIVLMPGINDGAVLEETLAWVRARPHITCCGIVPYGYTRYAVLQQGFDTPESARVVIEQVEAYGPRIQLADEFYLKAYKGEVLAHLPAAEYYAGFALYEDGIGMLRHFADTFASEHGNARFSSEKNVAVIVAGEQPGAVIVTGEAFAAFLLELYEAAAVEPPQILPVRNNFFGGNIDVAGLLTAEDILQQVNKTGDGSSSYLLPPAMFNDDGLTLDGKTIEDIKEAVHLSMSLKPVLSDAEARGG
jgi:NifB/MoaA-like Fe-S oxidoreductase